MGGKDISVYPNQGGMLIGKILYQLEDGVALLLPGSLGSLAGQKVKADYGGFALPAFIESARRSPEGTRIELRFADPTTELRPFL